MSAGPSTAHPPPARVEWLNGTERGKAVDDAVKREEFDKVAKILREKGYKPVPEKAVAARLERAINGRPADFLVVSIPFEGDPEKPTLIVVLLKPEVEVLALQLEARTETIKLLARKPAGKASLLLPTAQTLENYRVAPSYVSSPAALSSACQLPACGTYQAPDCQCTSWSLECFLNCCRFCTVCGTNFPCLFLCVSIGCSYCLVHCCTSWQPVCVDCSSAQCTYSVCCQNCPSCRSHPRCLGM